MKKYTLTFAVTLMAFGLALAQLPKSLGSAGGADIGSLVGQFADDAISPDALDSDFDLGGFAKKAKGISDVASIGKHVNKLIGHVKPGMFKDGVDPAKLMDMGNSVKSIADASGLMKKLNNGLVSKAFKGGWGQKSSLFNSALDALK
jgi:hypothetical protein